MYLHSKDSMIKNLLIAVDDEQTYKNKFKRIYMNFMYWAIGNTAQYLFFQQFCDSVHISDHTRVQEENQFAVLNEFIEEGIKREILVNEPIDYLLELMDAFLSANVEYMLKNPEHMKEEEFIKKSFEYLWRSIKS